MRSRRIEYPHPVLNEINKDFIDSSFSIRMDDYGDDGDKIRLVFSCVIESSGLTNLINAGTAKVIIRVTCPRTMYRRTYELTADKSATIDITKRDIADFLDLQGIVVSTKEISNYSLMEFNQDYFANASFSLRKGDVLATESGFRIRLNSILEQDASGIVLVREGKNITNPTVYFATLEDIEPGKTDYIYITLPEREYITYHHLRTKKHMKNGIGRFLQSSLILPAIVEGIQRIIDEELQEDPSEHYKGTIWADAVVDAFRREYQINEISECSASAYEIANRILGNVLSDSLNNLYQKMEEWSRITQEDELL